MNAPSLLLSLILASGPVALDPRPAGAPVPALPQTQDAPFVGPSPADQPDTPGVLLVQEYEGAVQAWDKRRLQLSLGGKTPDPKELGPHPVRDFEPRFRLLAESGSGVAQAWMLENWKDVGGTDDAIESARRFEQIVGQLLGKNASQTYMGGVANSTYQQRALLGRERVEHVLQQIHETSTNKEVCARAMLNRALLRRPADPTQPPSAAAADEAREMYRTIVAAWPGTKGALDAAMQLATSVNADFERRVSEWSARCIELSKAGRAITDWPPPPFDAMLPEYAPLAEAGAPSAVRWVNHYFNAIANARTNGPGRDLAAAARGIGIDYPGATEGVALARAALFELLFQQFGGEAWIDASFDDISATAEQFTPDQAERAFRPVFERGLGTHARAAALHVLARACIATGKVPDYDRALAACDRMERECAGDALVETTAALCDPLRKNRVGEPAPAFESQDAENKIFSLADYRGRVVLLSWFNMFIGQGLDDQRSWREFQSANLSRPFHVVGVNAGPMDRQGFYDRAARLGISFRTALLYRNVEANTQRWAVKRFPTTIAIDADGVIRGRDLPWPEMKALLEKLIAEAEAKQPKR